MKLRIALYLSLAVLLVSGVLGLYNGLTEWGDGRTALQHSVAIGVLVYGVLGIIASFGLIRRRPWSVRTAIAWGISITYVPGAAVLAYAEGQAPVLSAVMASLLSAAIAIGVVCTARALQRQEAHLRD